MNLRHKQYRAKQRQAKNMVIISIMQETGWSRERVLASLEELERYNMVKFPENGGMMLKVGEVD